MVGSRFKSSADPGPTSPRRPRTGKSIRGKISGPIPIPDDEFPIRQPGAGIATPVSDRPNPTSPVPPAPQPQPDETRTHARTDSAMGPSGGPGSTSGSARGPSVMARGSPQSHQRNNPSSTLRQSVVSEATDNTGNTGNTGNSKSKPQRKKSTIRGAFSKLFGRKKKNESISTIPEPTSTTQDGSTQHQSQPPGFARQKPKEIESKRVASMPVTEFDRALRSHSIGPNDLTTIESVRNSVHGELGWASRPRAATTTSLIFRGREGEPSGLSPRPASSHIRGSRTYAPMDDEEQIGRAITSDLITQKRRSRSLSNLGEVTDDRHEIRRRSDEIRYWRQSYDPAFMSPISSDAPEFDADPDLNRHHLAEDGGDGEAAELPRPSEDRIPPPKTPPQPFNFGNMTHLNAMAGMKITQAASLESRLESMEARTRRIETVLAQLCNATPGFRPRLDSHEPDAPPVPPLDPSVYASQGTHTSDSFHSKDTHTTFGEAAAHLDAPDHRCAAGRGGRPTSDATIREAVSMPHIPRSPSAPPPARDHYSSLLALVKTERASRQLLESQVRTLTQRLDSLMSGTSGAQRPSTAYLDPPPTARSFGNASAFDHEDSGDENHFGYQSHDNNQLGIIVNPQAYTNGTRNLGVVPEDSGIATGSTTTAGDDDDYSEAFETPKEEYPSSNGAGAFGEDLGEDEVVDDAKRKKTARTLSLSQLTLGGKTKPKAVI